MTSGSVTSGNCAKVQGQFWLSKVVSKCFLEGLCEAGRRKDAREPEINEGEL